MLQIAAGYPRTPSLPAMQTHPFRARLLVGSVTLCILAGNGLPAQAENWPQWRGPEGNGASRETNLPIAWNQTSGIVWQCPLPEWGNSTPAIWQNAIFVTTQVDNEKLLLLKINKRTGRIEWTREVGAEPAPHLAMQQRKGEQRRHQSFHESNNFASPSPVTDGQRVVVHFGNGELAAYDFDGQQLWHRNLQKDYGDYTNWWGHASSPVLYDNLVISICLQDSCADLPGEPAPSYVVAHDLRTGRERWKMMRMPTAGGEDGDAYTTPIFWQNGDQRELVVMGGRMLDAYDPASGKRLWNLPELIGSRTIPSPVAAEGTIYATQGMRKPLLAVRPDGDGKRTRQDVVWQFDQGSPDSPTPVPWGQSLFLVTNDGIARCLDAASGRVEWKERLKGEYRASPLAADGRIYFLNTKGLTTVMAASPRMSRLTENELDDATFASPIVSDGRIFIRGRKALYCLGK
jgi:outer membrane protein assembly factor BamB